MTDAPAKLSCSFCAKSQDDVTALIAGPGVNICDECIALSMGVLMQRGYGIAFHKPAKPVEAKLPERGWTSGQLVRWAAWEAAARMRGEPDDALAEQYVKLLRAFIEKPPGQGEAA